MRLALVSQIVGRCLGAAPAEKGMQVVQMVLESWALLVVQIVLVW